MAVCSSAATASLTNNAGPVEIGAATSKRRSSPVEISTWGIGVSVCW